MTDEALTLEEVERLSEWIGHAHEMRSRLAARSRAETYLPGSLAPELMRRSEELLDSDTLHLIGSAVCLARAHIEAGGWQPIETAPKDGTAIIATDGRLVFRTGNSRYYEKWPHQEGGPTYSYRWTYEDNSSFCSWSPTHWMPLPKEPETDHDK